MIMDRVVEISTVKPEWDDVVVIKIDFGNMPAHLRVVHAENTLKTAREVFPKNKIAIISSKDEFVLQKE